MFSIMTWPGAFEKYEREIERRAQEFMNRVDPGEGEAQRAT